MKRIFYFWMFLFSLGPVIGCGTSGEVTIDARWLPRSVDALPTLHVTVENHSKNVIMVPTFEGKPMVFLDYWVASEGLVLVGESHFRILRGAFVVLKTISVAPGAISSFDLDLKDFVANGGENAGTRKWQDDFVNEQSYVRAIARLDIEGKELHSCYAYLGEKAGKRAEPKKP